MEQNLTERERKQRLALGVFFGIVSIGMFLTDQSNLLTGIAVLFSIGFIANYFTCFCGTKRAIKALKSRL